MKYLQIKTNQNQKLKRKNNMAKDYKMTKQIILVSKRYIITIYQLIVLKLYYTFSKQRCSYSKQLIKKYPQLTDSLPNIHVAKTWNNIYSFFEKSN